MDLRLFVWFRLLLPLHILACNISSRRYISYSFHVWNLSYDRIPDNKSGLSIFPQIRMDCAVDCLVRIRIHKNYGFFRFPLRCYGIFTVAESCITPMYRYCRNLGLVGFDNIPFLFSGGNIFKTGQKLF